MELFDHLALGLSVALTPTNLIFAFVGVLLGTLIGVLPGIGPMATIAMLLPMTMQFEPATAIIMLAGVYYGAQYGGSTAAILINVPGEVSAAVTAIDGYQMARQGRAGPALATAAVGSFFAGTVATVALALMAPPLAAIALKFSSPEYFSLMLLGLVMAIALAHGSPLKSIAMIILGLLLGVVGADQFSGRLRFTFGYLELAEGVSFLAVVVGFFGIAEILRNLEHQNGRQALATKIKGLMPTREELRRIIGPILRGTGLGTFLGVLPGNGPVLAAFSSYTIEKKLSKNQAEFGHGAIEGVAGPESANNAAAQTSFVPMLTLGIPTNPVMALMLGALLLNGVIPGPEVINRNPELFWGLIASMWVGNAMLVVLNLPLIGLWVKLLTVPYRFLFPAIITFASIGVYSISANSFHLYALALFGVLGYALIRVRCEPAPLMLGFILGPLVEEHLRRSLIVSRGDPMVFFERPISATLLGLALVAAIIIFLPMVAKRREQVFQEEEA